MIRPKYTRWPRHGFAAKLDRCPRSERLSVSNSKWRRGRVRHDIYRLTRVTPPTPRAERAPRTGWRRAARQACGRVEAADERDCSISIAMRFLDGVAQALELVGLAEQTSSSPFCWKVCSRPSPRIQRREDSPGLPSDRGRFGTHPVIRAAPGYRRSERANNALRSCQGGGSVDGLRAPALPCSTPHAPSQCR